MFWLPLVSDGWNYWKLCSEYHEFAVLHTSVCSWFKFCCFLARLPYQFVRICSCHGQGKLGSTSVFSKKTVLTNWTPHFCLI